MDELDSREDRGRKRRPLRDIAIALLLFAAFAGCGALASSWLSVRDRLTLTGPDDAAAPDGITLPTKVPDTVNLELDDETGQVR